MPLLFKYILLASAFVIEWHEHFDEYVRCSGLERIKYGVVLRSSGLIWVSLTCSLTCSRARPLSSNQIGVVSDLEMCSPPQSTLSESISPCGPGHSGRCLQRQHCSLPSSPPNPSLETDYSSLMKLECRRNTRSSSRVLKVCRN